MRVAWVDDVEAIRHVARRIVERAGGSCVGFRDHASLLASEEGPFDAAVLQPGDVIAANDVLAELRRRGVGTVLISSGDTQEGLLDAGIDLAAFDGFLGKPFSAREAVSRLGLDGEQDGVAS